MSNFYIVSYEVRNRSRIEEIVKFDTKVFKLREPRSLEEAEEIREELIKKIDDKLCLSDFPVILSVSKL